MKKIRLIEPQIDQEAIDRVEEVLRSGWLTEGPVTQEFEKLFAAKVGARFGAAVCNCTLALELALRALKLRPDDEVIVPDFTHPATAQAVVWAGAKPVLVDVDVASYNIDSNNVRAAINDNTKCVIPVSWGGNPLNMKPYDEIKKDFNLTIVEDSACSIGSEYSGVKTGSAADVSCFSLHPRKIITTGEGGMITTNNEELFEEMNSLKKFGERIVNGKMEFFRMGTNFKLSNILAAVGISQLRKLDEIIDRRRELAKNYDQLLSGSQGIRIPKCGDNVKHVYQTYAVYVEQERGRDRIMKDLRNKGIEVQIGTYALHLQPAFKDLKRIGSLENSDKLYHNLLALPMSSSMSFEDQEYVVSEVERVLNNRGS
jgi:dTDP-4-amino-4,6-dideoxygalactose transaminase